MKNITVNFSEYTGIIKPMHSVNNGPIDGRNICNGDLFREAGIPFVRNHDAAFCANYGGSHTVDIPAIFPNFDADENDPEAYDFTLTDMYTKRILDTGTRVFYRLGVKIEHEIKKYGTIPPRDFAKWARICEHIIRHYNYGWADGFNMNIEYWEIWNEPDLPGLCWQGTDEQFFEMFETAAMHLKKCFPELKIGGPAFCYYHDYVDKFFEWMTGNGKRVPIDFVSWHHYGSNPDWIGDTAKTYRRIMDKYGYTDAESILNEWNYIRHWEPAEEMKYNYKVILKSVKGASYITAAMCTGQKSSLDHMMYYDARPCAFNGLFDSYTLEPLRGYYSLKFFNELYKLKNEAECNCTDNNIYALAACDGKEYALNFTYFTDDDNAVADTVMISFAGIPSDAKLAVEMLDEQHESVVTDVIHLENGKCEMKLEPCSVLLLKYMG